MTWATMKRLEPQLATLEAEARAAGRSGKDWNDTWANVLYEPLTALCGFGSVGRFRSARDFEVAHKGLLWAWAGIDDTPNTPPWDIEGETQPLGPALGRAM